MKLLKPNWVNHDEKPIFSVDIHPAGKRFATGGQGGDSGRVVVWNLNPVLYESVELDPNVPKMLCQMDNHLACVNCVRWSNNGRYLASGGDDKLVMVWALTGGSSTILGGKQNAETWRCVSTLRGHAGDVLDLAWSPLDKWLASCSIDNSIIIWNAEKFPEMVSVLNGHTGLVKGVAWDPVGKYLASQSDDKTLRVWKTADWAQEYVVTEPFEECGGTTHVLRLSWSPDGQYVVSAHAMNGGGPTAQVVERDGWRCEKDFVGHRKAVICVRFNSNILVKEGKKCCCAAVGSRDRALSIWLTSLKRPLVVINDLFNDSVLDISWSSDGLNLLACSSDGSVACIQFTNKEIGTPLTVDEKNSFYEKIYGKCLVKEDGGLSGSSLLLECPEILDAREKTQQNTSATKELTPVSAPTVVRVGNGPVSSTPVSSTPVRPMDRQIETRTSDGKRRITPVFIPLTQHNNESMSGNGATPEACFSTSSQSKSRIRVERRDDIIIHPNVSNHATSANSSSSKNDDTVCDPRLKKRCVSSLPGPAVGVCGGGAGGASVGVPPSPAPGAPVPRLGAVGPVVRSAGPYRVVLSSRTLLSLVPANSGVGAPLWESPLPAPATALCASPAWVVATTEDGALHVWTLERGAPPRRALPPVQLGAPGVRAALHRDRAVVLTARGDLTVYCLRTATAETGPVQVPGAAPVTGVSLLECGAPVAWGAGGRGQVYVGALRGWVWWWERPPRVPPAPPRPWLESQVAVCRALGVPREYRHWSLALTSHVASEGPEWALRALLDDMLGPTHSSPLHSRWEDTVLGIHKHHLLEEMLAIVIKHLKWQRLYTEYNDQLKDLRAANQPLLNGH